MGEDWLGAPGAAQYLGVTLRTVYKLIDEGDIPAYKIGRVFRIRRSDLDDFLERHGHKPGELAHRPLSASGRSRRTSTTRLRAHEGEPFKV